jgi:hypothetical protein
VNEESPLAEKLTGFLFYIHSNLLDDPMNPITQPTQIDERLMGSFVCGQKRNIMVSIRIRIL